MAELGGKQLSTLLESLPGIASVLRSPVADAVANLIRAAGGVGVFREDDVQELLQYATRRGLMADDEASQLVADVKHAWTRSRKRSDGTSKKKKPSPKRPAPKKTVTAGTPSVPKTIAPAPKTTVTRVKVAKKATPKATPKVAAQKPAAKRITKRAVVKKAKPAVKAKTKRK